MKNFISSIIKAVSGKADVHISVNNNNTRSFRNGDTIVGEGTCVEEKRKVTAFSKIDVGGSFNVRVDVIEGHDTEVIVKAQSNILPLVKTYVVNQTLEVEMSGSSTTNQPLEVHVKTSSLAAITVQGSANFELHGINEDSFFVDISGSADVNVSGQVHSLSADVSGSAGLNFTKTKIAKLHAHVNGAAHVHANVSDSVQLDISGAATVVVTGKPGKRTVNKSGAADVMFV